MKWLRTLFVGVQFAGTLAAWSGVCGINHLGHRSRKLLGRVLFVMWRLPPRIISVGFCRRGDKA
jgi:hypothetical protein